MSEAWVYTVWADNDALYVGCTSDLPARIREHKSGKAWMKEATSIQAVRYPTEREGFQAERERIGQLHPLHNVIYNNLSWREREPEIEYPLTARARRAAALAALITKTAVPVAPMPQGDGNAPGSCAACEASTDSGAPTPV